MLKEQRSYKLTEKFFRNWGHRFPNPAPADVPVGIDFQ
jgi:hypothetical protein